MPRRKKQEQVTLEEDILQEDDELLEDEENTEEVFEDDDEELVAEDESDSEYEDDDETLEEETEAARTLRPNSKPDTSTKAGMMNAVISAMGQMTQGDMIKFFELSMAQAKDAAGTISSGQAGQNLNSVKAKGSPVKEDLEALFGGNEELSEDFQEKVEAIFEAALNTRIELEIARLEEQYTEALEEEVANVTEELNENVDRYLDYVAAEWLEENELAVETSLRTSLTEEFMGELTGLCRKFNFNLPEGQDEVLEDLATKVGELEGKLNEEVEKNIALSEHAEELEKEIMIEEMAQEVPATKYEKFKKLAENIEYDGDGEKFLNKLTHIQEGYFESSQTRVEDSQLINEEIANNDDEENSPTFLSPEVKLIHDTISRTVKK